MEVHEIVYLLNKMAINTGTLNCFGCGHEHNCGTRGCAVMREAADTLEYLSYMDCPEHAQTEWRLVDNELPADDTLMLVTCRTKKGVLSVNRAYYSNGVWHGSGSMAGVIAWMPLPEPYDPEDIEKEGKA